MIEQINRFFHHHLLKLLLLMYGLGLAVPNWGVSIRNTSLAKLSWDSSSEVNLSIPLLLLSWILLNAGLSVNLTGLKRVLRIPFPLFIGLSLKTLAPLAFALSFALLGYRFWPDPEQIQNTLIGFAIIASMPIAGSSTAWVQNARGNPALILGLVVASTLASPLLSPLVFHSVALVTPPDCAKTLRQIADQGVGPFLVISVMIPSLLGIAIRWIMGEKAWARISPFSKLITFHCLLILNYSNAAVSLPFAFGTAWDAAFFTLNSITTLSLCILGFMSGWIIPKFLKIQYPDRIALTYGLGMNNNGTGLVLATNMMADDPLIMLPLITYNVCQQISAGFLGSWLFRKSAPSLSTQPQVKVK